MDSKEFMAHTNYVVDKYRLQKWFNHLPKHGDYQREILNWINRNVPKDAKILELGCGIGHNLIQLADWGFTNLHGIEKDQATYMGAVDMVHHFKCPAVLFNGDVNDGIPEQMGDFDVIIPMGFTYFKEIKQDWLFNHCSERLNVGGHLILDVVDPGWNPEKTYPYYNRKSISDMIEFAMTHSMMLTKISTKCHPKNIGYFKKMDNADNKAYEMKYWKLTGIRKGTEIYQKYLDLFKPKTKGMAILDVGCGPLGGLCSKIKDAKMLVGVDTLAEEYKRIIKADNILLKSCAAENIPANDNSFDIVFCTNVLDHTNNPERAIKEMHRVLKPGGKLYLLVHLRISEQLNIGHPYVIPQEVLEVWLSCRGFNTQFCSLYTTDPVNGDSYKTFKGELTK